MTFSRQTYLDKINFFRILLLGQIANIYHGKITKNLTRWVLLFNGDLTNDSNDLTIIYTWILNLTLFFFS